MPWPTLSVAIAMHLQKPRWRDFGSQVDLVRDLAGKGSDMAWRTPGFRQIQLQGLLQISIEVLCASGSFSANLTGYVFVLFSSCVSGEIWYRSCCMPVNACVRISRFARLDKFESNLCCVDRVNRKSENLGTLKSRWKQCCVKKSVPIFAGQHPCLLITFPARKWCCMPFGLSRQSFLQIAYNLR